MARLASTLLLACILTASSVAAPLRPTLPLDGEWHFRLDPDNIGEKDGWADRADFKDAIQVPGAWDAQGFGSPTDKLHHNFVGKAWYRREIVVPSGWTGKKVFLCIGGVHRYADTWINGQHVGEHIGYLSPFEFDLTSQAQPGQALTIAIRVDSKQRWEVDALTGCFDMIDEMFTNWGGIWGHVWLEAREAAWLRDLHIQPRIAPAGCRVTARLSGEAPADGVRVEIFDDGQAVTAMELPLAKAKTAGGEIALDVDVPNARLWTPDTPHLYTARLALMRGGKPVDQIESRFGLREIKVSGHSFVLNGSKLFLSGYGDDAIYPETMAAPSDKSVYLKRLRFAKDCGFNFVRHHSTMLPPEYYEAADEVGMLVSAEFPIAYQEYYQRAKGPALELYKTEWAAAITRLRNHPSIFDWCMGNEQYGSIPIAPELYRIARSLDPGRLVIDSDGLTFDDFIVRQRDRATLDFYAVQFNCFALPLDQPGKYQFEITPKKPMLCHETGNFATFPRMSEIEAFRHNLKPFWLTPAREKLQKLGLLEEAEQWSRNSEHLYVLAHKLNLEALRRNPKMSGYMWWLLQDYWTGSNGIVDHYFRPKEMDLAYIRQFNGDVVLLLDGLDVTCTGGNALKLELRVSNFSPGDLADAKLTWQVLLQGSVTDRQTQPAPSLAQGELTLAAKFASHLPDVLAPQQLKIKASLEAGGKTYNNEWTSWVYPAEVLPPRTSAPLWAEPDLMQLLAGSGARALTTEPAASRESVLVVSELTRPTLEQAAAGARVVCLRPQLVLPSIGNRFKPAWWVGNASDCNTGTVVYDQPLVRGIAPEGWADAGWFHVLEGSEAFVLDEWPTAPEVLVRAIDVHTQCRSKAVLLQARVGKGAIIVSGLNLGTPGHQRPEQQWLLNRLIEHAADANPKAELSVDWLRKRIEAEGLPEGPCLNGFARLLSNQGETTTYATHRGTDGTLYVCRQKATGQRVEWESTPLPANTTAPITFVFGGGLGWRSQPKSQGFALLINGKEALRFDVATEHKTWRSQDGKVSLRFVPKRNLPEDALGLFYLTIPADAATAGQPCRLAVESLSSGSQRWFALTP